MDSKELVPVLLRQLLERARTNEAGVRNKNVCATKVVQCGLDDALAVFRRGDRSDSLAASYTTPLSVPKKKRGVTWHNIPFVISPTID